MFKLIKLELRKHRIKTFLYAIIGIFIFCLGFCFLTAYIPKLEQAAASVASVADMKMFTEWNSFIILMSTLVFGCFSVLSATMFARFIVDEYTGKRAILLFSYPQKRSSILLAKCILVFGFTVLCNAICTLLAVSIFALISNAVGIMSEVFTAETFMLLLKNTIVFSLLAASVGLIALRIGIWRKSLIATIVTAVILIMPFSNLASFLPDSSFTILLIGLLILIAVGVTIFLRLLARVNKMEAV